MPFPGTPNYFMAPAVAGSFASTNPRASAASGQRAFIAASGGVTVGAFVWQTVTTAPNNTPSGWVQQGATVANSGSGTPTGFAAIDDRNASWSTILTETGYLIQAGNIVSVYNAGDFWAISSTATSIGQKVFASNLNGSIQTAAAGSIISNYTETQFYVATNNATGEVFMMSSFPQH